jgi:oligoribonuclease
MLIAREEFIMGGSLDECAKPVGCQGCTTIWAMPNTSPFLSKDATYANPVEQVSLAKSDLNLVWLDCEMSGLEPERDRLLEIAVIVTSPDLSIRIEGPVLVIHQSDEVLSKMDAWNRGTHGKSGLTEKVKASSLTEAQAQDALIAFIKPYVSKGVSPMCGNTIGQDRRFLNKYMPKLEAWFHYRNVDVSTLKELARRWKPDVFNAFKKAQKHTALADVHESIDEMLHYKEHFLNLN